MRIKVSSQYMKDRFESKVNTQQTKVPQAKIPNPLSRDRWNNKYTRFN